jgi:hypothetical protein
MDDYIAEDTPVRAVDAFAKELDLEGLPARVDPVHRLGSQPLEHVTQVGLWVVPIHAGALQPRDRLPRSPCAVLPTLPLFMLAPRLRGRRSMGEARPRLLSGLADILRARVLNPDVRPTSKRRA